MVCAIAITGCQAATSHPNNSKESAQIAANKKIKKKRPMPCKAGSPPIKDRSKLKTMLTKSGKITNDMPLKKINDVINDYIKKKQQAFTHCNK